jgi:hypothetical protein
MSALVNSLTVAEQSLIRETERDRMDPLDEDALLELHGRIRRARNKYVGQYRRTASARVGTVGGRGMARPKNRRNFDRAEVFEDALARVSRRLATVARQNAAELKAERIAAARSDRNSGPGSARTTTTRPGSNAGPTRRRSQTIDRSPNSPALEKRRASTQAKGARRQAAKDSR